MKPLAIDTQKVVTILQENGFSQGQAEALVEAARQADLSEIATRSDISELRAELYKVSAAQTLVIIGAMIALAVI